MDTQWRKICNNLQKRLNSGSYKVWVEPLRATMTPAGIDLAAPSAFVADWVRERLLPDILEAAAEVCGRPLAVTIRAASSPAAVRRNLAAAAAPRRAEAAAGRPGETVSPAWAAGPDTASAGLSPVSCGCGAGLGPDLPAAAPVRDGAAAAAFPAAPSEDVPRPFPAPLFSVGAEQLPLPLAMPAPRQAAPRTWRYAFETFVVGPTNDMAYAAARNMTRPGAAVDMLFLSSGPGLGKTHLTQAVGHALCRSSNRANPKVEYLTAEEFSSCFVQALRLRDMERFKGRFRDVDLLLLEDIHFLQGKEKMQDEVLSTIKSLQGRGSRVVLTSSFAPCDLKNVDNQLVSRFCSGFLAGIDKPDADTRRRILAEKAREHGTTLPEPVAELLAERLTGDIRQLESCVHTLVLKARLLGHELSVDMAAEILARYAQENPLLSVEAIVRKVCEGFGLSPEQLRSRSRKQDHVLARNTIFYLARRHTALSLQDIGDRFNRRHSTVLKGIASVECELRRESTLGRQIASTLALVERSRA